MPETQKPQLIKIRDDHEPIKLQRKNTDLRFPTFDVDASTPCPWAQRDIGTDKLRERIEPWLTALFQSEHLSLLVGSGMPIALNTIAKAEAPSPMSAANFGSFTQQINAEAKRTATAAGRTAVNIEDQIRVATDLLAGLRALTSVPDTQVHKLVAEQVPLLETAIEETLKNFSGSILGAEQALVQAPEASREKAFQYLTSFLMSFASRTGTRDRLNIFTTNYDRYIEMGADIAGLRLIDRFVGTLSPIFRSSRLDVDLHYNPPGIRGEPRFLEGVARFTKLHGSIDWASTGLTIRRMGLPFGTPSIAPFLTTGGGSSIKANQLMIYPNSSKDRETAQYPYVELFRDLSAAICRPNCTLLTYGFSFGDEHINRVIEDMLTIPSTHLVVISRSDTLGRITKLYEKRPAQISLLIGDHLSSLEALVDHYLPKPAIDKTTFRMAELLKARFAVARATDSSDPVESDQGQRT
jgi:hypothetical protein